MGSTNRTTNYDLSQFVGNDKPSWLSDYNGDMAKIDTAIKARSVEAGAAQTTADTANGKADALDTRMGTAENNITALQNASTTDHTQIATNTANISKNAQDIVQLDAKIGHTQITIGDHTVTGAIATLAGQGGVEADNVSYDNTKSGLTADDVQEAIDELAARPTVADASDVTFDNTGTTLQATNVENAIKEVASTPASNVRWNSTTDRFEVLKNGSWVQSIRAFVNALAVFVNGLFGLSYSQDKNPLESSYTLASPFTVSGNEIDVPNITSDRHSAGMLFESVDMTTYSTMKVKTNITGSENITVNVSAVSANCYPYIAAFQNAGGTKKIRIGISNINNDEYAYESNTPAYEDVTLTDFSTARITEITIE